MTYKAYIVNFELLYVSDESADVTAVLQDSILAEIRQASTNGFNAIVGLMLVDGFLYKDNQAFYSLLNAVNEECKKLNIKKVVLIAGMCADYQQTLDNKNIPFEIMFFDFNLNLVYQSYKENINQLPEWNPNTDKFLFLGGAPARHNRISLLYKLYTSGLLSKADWSFFKPWVSDDIAWCRDALSFISDDEYTNFLNNCDRSVDDKYSESKDYSKLSAKDLKTQQTHSTKWCQDPGWIDPSIFYNTSLSIISEGNIYSPAHDYNFLTEKTWRTVINKHPFIFAGDPAQFKYLEQQGINSFRQYITNPNYAYIRDEDERLNAVVDSTFDLLYVLHTSQEQFKADIEQNYQLFFKKVKQNNQLLDRLRVDFNVDIVEIDKWFNQKSFVHIVGVT